MRSFVGIIIIILFVACTRNKSVQVSGRVAFISFAWMRNIIFPVR